MNNKKKQIHELQKLAQLDLNINLSRLSQITQAEDAPRSILAQLASDRKAQLKQHNPTQAEIPQSTLAGTDLKWQNWANSKQRETMSNLAQIAQKRELQLLKTRRAFGRVDALVQIEKKLDT